MTEPCAVADCRPLVGAHIEGCAGAPCRGCEPRRAAPPWLACPACGRGLAFNLAELAVLNEALLMPTRSPGGSSPSWEPLDDARSADGSLCTTRAPGADAHLWMRHEIRAVLVAWCKLLAEDDAISRPLRALPADTVPAMCSHLARWKSDLLSSDLASDACIEIGDLVQRARRLAYPSKPLQKLGECPACGTIVRSATTDGEVTCRGCGIVSTVADWKAAMDGDLAAETAATADQLITWLNMVHPGAGVTSSRFRQWASDGAGPAVSRVVMRRVGRDHAGRALYSVADATQIAQMLYGSSCPCEAEAMAPNR